MFVLFIIAIYLLLYYYVMHIGLCWFFDGCYGLRVPLNTANNTVCYTV